ncbi:hypothetical protein SUGI_0557500 [Cryptomeria japonica]|nr:hypothetical protein SUGI_0557500 [Cryptomeria japonica]
MCAQGRLLDLADQKLDGNFQADKMEWLLLQGLLCSHPDPKARPKMRDVVKILKFESQMPDVPLNLPVVVYENPVSRGLASSSITSTFVSLSLSCIHHPLFRLLVLWCN